jgi:hypothetical protein
MQKSLLASETPYSKYVMKMGEFVKCLCSFLLDEIQGRCAIV